MLLFSFFSAVFHTAQYPASIIVLVFFFLGRDYAEFSIKYHHKINAQELFHYGSVKSVVFLRPTLEMNVVSNVEHV